MNRFDLQTLSDHTFNPLKAVPRKIPDKETNSQNQTKDKFFQEFQRPTNVKLNGQNEIPQKMTTITVSDLNNLRAIKKNMQKDSQSGIDKPNNQPGINKNLAFNSPPLGATNSVTNAFPGLGNVQNYKKGNFPEITNNPSTQIDNAIKTSNQFNKKNMAAMQMRQRFQGLLGKLIELETREIAVNQLKELIMQHQTEEHLRLWISALSEYHARHQFYASWEQEVLLIGFIANVYKENLLDPADKPPSLIKSSFKLCEMIQKYFQSKQCGEAISQACGESWVSIYENCLKRQSTANKSLVLYTTLKNILTGGGDRQAQLTALVVLEALLEKLKDDGDIEFVQNITKTFFTNIYVRNGIETFSTFHGCQHIVETLHIKNLIPYTSLIVEKALSVLNDRKSTNYKVKIGACGLLETLGIQFQSMTENLVGSYHDEVLQTLGECCRDRVLLVQAAAKQALLQWTKFQKQFEELEQFKLHKQRKSNGFDVDIDSLIQERTSQKSTAKGEQFYKPKNSRGFLRFDEYEENRLPTKNVNQPKEFVKKKSGTGGGSVAVNSDDVRIRPASKYREMSQLKNHIMRLREEQQGQMMDANSEILNDTVKMDDSLEDQDNNNHNSNNHSRISDGLEDTIRVRGVSFNDEPEVDQLAETMDFNSSKGRFPSKGILRSAENKGIGINNTSKDMKNFKNQDNYQTQSPEISQETEFREIWAYSIDQADKGNFQQAFQTILDSGDDLYLIRLMLRNKQGFKVLNDIIKTQITMKLLQQMERQYLMRLCMGFLGQGAEDQEIFKEMSAVECNEIVQVLEIAKGGQATAKSNLATKAERLQGLYQRQLDQLQQQQQDYE